MSVLNRRQQSKKDHATDWLGTAGKAAVVGVLARGAGQGAKKGAKKGAKRGAKTVAKRGGKSLGRRIAPFAALGAVALLAAKKLRGGSEPEAWQQASANGSPTPVTPPEPATRP